jgi:hypothetical protein
MSQELSGITVQQDKDDELDTHIKRLEGLSLDDKCYDGVNNLDILNQTEAANEVQSPRLPLSPTRV